MNETRDFLLDLAEYLAQHPGTGIYDDEHTTLIDVLTEIIETMRTEKKED